MIWVLGEMSRMQSRAQNTVPRGPRVSHQCDPSKIFRTPHRNNGRTPGPYQRSGHGALQCLLRKGVLQFLRTLRQKDLRRLQKRTHGHP